MNAAEAVHCDSDFVAADTRVAHGVVADEGNRQFAGIDTTCNTALPIIPNANLFPINPNLMTTLFQTGHEQLDQFPITVMPIRKEDALGARGLAIELPGGGG